MKLKLMLLVILSMALVSCGDQTPAPKNLIIISATINGAALTEGLSGVQIDSEISLVFDASVDLDQLKAHLSLEAEDTMVPVEVLLSNAQSKAQITADLSYKTQYTLTLSVGEIGASGESLQEGFMVNFTTAEDEIIRELAPCTNLSCIETLEVEDQGQSASFDFYSSHPILLENAQWETLRNAVIVVHGQNRDADNYFIYLTTALRNTELQNNTVLLAPWFKGESDASDQDFYWNTSSWREGQPSNGHVRISSFALVDSLINILVDKSRFPVLEKILVTGHSSGGLFTHVYAGANFSQSIHSAIDFEYVVANSQYLYYPNNYRYNELAGTFFEPSDCAGYNYWPLGFQSAPSYLNGLSPEDFNGQFAGRKVVYFLGNNTSNDGALNTSDCSATLLGSTRYQRGENIFTFMNAYYPGQHAHTRSIVDGIGHDGQGMFLSQEFSILLSEKLN